MIDLAEATAGLIGFVKANATWAPYIVGALAFAESLAFISLFVPATAILLGVGGLVGVGALEFWPAYAGAAGGAILGDWVSYAVAWRFKDRIATAWPFSRYPGVLERGEAFFRRFGWPSVFLGRFIGPVRAVVPVVAAVSGMPLVPFQVANVTSALVWAGVLLGPGYFAARQLAA